jgi:hypothetical protein
MTERSAIEEAGEGSWETVAHGNEHDNPRADPKRATRREADVEDQDRTFCEEGTKVVAEGGCNAELEWR